MYRGRVYQVCIGTEIGKPKTPCEKIFLKTDFGVIGDIHGGTERQVSLLSIEDIISVSLEKVKPGPGIFAENITTEGIDLVRIPPGTKLTLGKKAVVEITQIGKECHSGCSIMRFSGRCIMPLRGVFARVVKSGWVHPGDAIEVIE